PMTTLSSRSSVHPHVRGDDQGLIELDPAVGGSPPRAWGRRRGADMLVPERRFTPTCVGTTRAASRPPRCHSVHPHVRGDDEGRFTRNAPLRGSPPRAWGRLPARSPACRVWRFTPTCVGTTRELA